MLTIKKETEIRQLLNENPKASNRSIGEVTGVSRNAVQRIRETMATIREIGVTKTLMIRRLLLSGLPLESIISETKVSANKIKQVSLAYYLQRRKPGSPISDCPTCGATMFSDEYKAENRTEKETGRVLPPDISESQSVALWRTVVDLCELDGLCIITNPLFHLLAKRAKPILEEINDSQEEN